ncbi:MAG TPA: bifunctional lysylphosphatidylglycerol synthetase/lysine--tRNA ligase LysX [Micromonosporaceae bacterium]|nr:bifunctional lysylphosphatidylglycerol synthetase/lysine--tRNA ligase LysX [Micromonosporaceae bacterium]
METDAGVAQVATATSPGRRSERRPPNDWTARVPTVLSVVLGALSALCALAAVSEAAFARSQPIREAISDVLLPAPPNLAYAAFVGILGASLARRKRLAFKILLGYLGAQIIADLGLLALLGEAGHAAVRAARLSRAPWYAASSTAANLAIVCVVLGVLWLSRKQFFAQVQPASVRKAATVLVGGVVACSLAGWALVTAFPGSLKPGDRLVYSIEKVLGGAFVFDITRSGHAPEWVNLLLGLGGAITIFAVMWALFASQRSAATVTADEEQRVRYLLSVYGEEDSLGYFATRRDKSVVFSESGKAGITYRVVAGVCLASGDPIGDREAWAPAIEAWLGLTQRYAWAPAVMGASEAAATAYARAGLRVLELGDEAILQVADFHLGGRDMRQVRQAVGRVRRAGYTVRVRRHAEIGADEMTRIIDLAARWRDTETERGFSMALGRLGDPADGRCVLIEAFDAAGRETAVLSFAPWGRDGLSLDLMRRDRTSDNGLIEFMVTELVGAAPDLGVARISLNFAVFRSVFEEGARIGAGPVLRAWRSLLLFFSRWFQLESLYRSNLKYRPEWLPRFLCFDDRRELAKVALASGIAEGFVVVPSMRTLLRRGRAATMPGIRGRRRVAALPATPVVVDVPPSPVLPVHAAGGGDAGADASAGAESAGIEVRRTEQELVRIGKLDALRAAGREPHPVGVTRSHTCAEIRSAYGDLEPGARTGARVATAGRVMLVRGHGALTFATIRDWSGDLQVMIGEPDMDAAAVGQWRATVDLGDLVAIAGEVVTSRRGELSVRAAQWQMASKCLHPLPDKHHGLVDPEARVRQRYVDLVVDPSARDMLRLRGAVLHAMRGALVGRDFVEVETPILQRSHGGANARPFVTASSAYNMRLFLRIAPELHLKRLAVGGVERVFEIGRTFRNEGVDTAHNPEFTMLEAYQAYADYADMRELARALILASATTAYGRPVARWPDGTETDIGGEWTVVTVHDAVAAALDKPVDPGTPAETLAGWARAGGVPLDPSWNRGQVLLECYERLVEAQTVAPTFYVDFPVEVSPLARTHRDDPRLAERWDLVAYGMEIGTAYSELTDPLEQRRRLTAQSLLAARGDAEAMDLDNDFLTALEYAMPPTGGLGLGVDRVVMALSGRTIREAIAFPLVKPSARG